MNWLKKLSEYSGLIIIIQFVLFLAVIWILNGCEKSILTVKNDETSKAIIEHLKYINAVYMNILMIFASGITIIIAIFGTKIYQEYDSLKSISINYNSKFKNAFQLIDEIRSTLLNSNLSELYNNERLNTIIENDNNKNINAQIIKVDYDGRENVQ